MGKPLMAQVPQTTQLCALAVLRFGGNAEYFVDPNIATLRHFGVQLLDFRKQLSAWGFISNKEKALR
jgi:hypothetical protein